MEMTNEQVITETINFVKQTLNNAEGGHDWWHIYRVWVNAKKIAEMSHAISLLLSLLPCYMILPIVNFITGMRKLALQQPVNFYVD